MNKTPPTPADLKEALAGIDSLADPDLPTKALHLALPSTVVVGLDVKYAHGFWWYRDMKVPAVADVFEQASLVASWGHVPTDRYLDLSLSPVFWPKILPSGFRQVVFAAELFLNTPPIAADSELTEEEVRAFLHTAYKETLTPPDVIKTELGEVLLDGTDESWVIRPSFSPNHPDASTQAPLFDKDSLKQRADDLAYRWKVSFQAKTSEVVELPPRIGDILEAEVLLDLNDHWQAIVPISFCPTGQSVGVQPSDILYSSVASIPPGFDFLGRSRWEEAAVARHRATNLTCLVRQV